MTIQYNGGLATVKDNERLNDLVSSDTGTPKFVMIPRGQFIIDIDVKDDSGNLKGVKHVVSR